MCQTSPSYKKGVILFILLNFIFTCSAQLAVPVSKNSAISTTQSRETNATTTSKDPKSTKKTLVYLEHSEALLFDQERLPGIQLLQGDVCFRHDNAYLYCDSAYFFEEKNSFNAYGHVKIVQGDSLFVYGDILYYDGNTRMARLRHNVKMENRQVTLTTDSLNYDRLNNVGYYFLGGRLQDDLNNLTSVYGCYYPDTDDALFNDSVVLINPKFTLNSDTLHYNTKTEIADILGPTTIIYKEETTIYSEKGWYNTRTEESQLLQNSHIYHEGGKHLTGETIFYDKKNGKGEVFKHIAIEDTVKCMTLYGNYSRYIEKGELALATDSALLMEYSGKDTLYIHADTLYSYAVDSTNKEVQAYHNVRLYRIDFQGVCDSAIYYTKDSTLHLLHLPILWSDKRQLTGDTIRAFLKDGQVDKVFVINSAFVCEQEDSEKYNQLSGKELVAYIRNGELQQVDVKGNAQSIFYPKEEDGSMIGFNQTESSYLSAYFKGGKLKRLVLKPKPSGIMYPLDQIPSGALYLRNFSWQMDYRPINKQDIFTDKGRERFTVAASKNNKQSKNAAKETSKKRAKNTKGKNISAQGGGKE
ncbi:MAG: hypothetical protein EOM76_01505 [Sphingobacteriia bacterium]|nr:hypothetical protein [Sphingobacteriia bacterium]